MDERLEKKTFKPEEKPEAIAGMRERLVARASADRREVDIAGRKFVVFPTVHAHAEEAEFFLHNALPHIQQGDMFLEVGCGKGTMSVFAALKGAHVTAVDINPAAVENTRENAQRNGVGHIDVIQSDVFANIPKDRKFRIIYWNVPFAYVDADPTSITPYGRTVFDPGHIGLKGLIAGARDHLEPGGEVLLGYSSTLGDMTALEAYAAEAGLRFEELASMIDPNDPEQKRRFELLGARLS